MSDKVLVITIVATADWRASVADIKSFVNEAVTSWGGSRHPDDPLFDSLEITKTSVLHIGHQ